MPYTGWPNGLWAPFATVPGSVATSTGPSAAGATGVVQVAYQGPDWRYYEAAATGTQWSPGAEPVGAPPASGRAGPASAALGPDAAVTYGGADNALYMQARPGGAWDAPQQAATALAPGVAPRLVTLASGEADLLVAYVGADLLLHYSVRTDGTWSAPGDITCGHVRSTRPDGAGG